MSAVLAAIQEAPSKFAEVPTLAPTGTALILDGQSMDRVNPARGVAGKCDLDGSRSNQFSPT